MALERLLKIKGCLQQNISYLIKHTRYEKQAYVASVIISESIRINFNLLFKILITEADASAAEVSLMSETIILILLIWLAVVTFFLFVVFIVVCCLCRRRSDDQKFRQSSAYGEYMNSYNNTLSKPTGHANGQMDEIPETNGDVNGKTPEKAIPRGLHISRTDSSDSFGWMGSMREDETAEYSVDTVQRMNSKRLAARHGGKANIGTADEQDNRLSVSKEELNNY